MIKRIAILVSGNGSNMEAIIKNTKKGILEDICNVVCVVANKKEAGGLDKARRHNIPAYLVESKGKSRSEFEKQLISVLNLHNPDFIVLAGFMRVLSPLFIDTFKDCVINIHPADTAVYQGTKGYEWAFENNLKETFITVHYVDEGVDTGLIIAKRKVDLEDATSLEEVKARGLAVESVFYSETLKDLLLELKEREELCVVS